jgi:hypothetical protein
MYETIQHGIWIAGRTIPPYTRTFVEAQSVPSLWCESRKVSKQGKHAVAEQLKKRNPGRDADFCNDTTHTMKACSDHASKYRMR